MLVRWTVGASVARQEPVVCECIGRRAGVRAVVVACMGSGMCSRGVPQKVEVKVVGGRESVQGNMTLRRMRCGLAEGGGVYW